MFSRILKKSNRTYNPIWLVMNKKCYDLTLELKEYLLSDYLLKQFPILQLPDYNENTMALHVNLIIRRMVLCLVTQLNDQSRQSVQDSKQFMFCCKTYLFADFANKYNEKYPIDSFSEYFIENYTNRVELLKSQIDILENDIQTLSSDEYTINTRQVIRKFIFLNKIDLGNPIIEKYSNYFLAHRNYLNSMNYDEMQTMKIHWGMQEDLKKIE